MTGYGKSVIIFQDKKVCVEIRSLNGVVIARGQTNFSSAECRKLAGKHSNEIREILGCVAEEEIIHRNSMAIVH
jgi:glutamate 5-kinase